MAHGGAHAGKQLVHPEGFCHVIIGSEVKSGNFASLIAAARQHDDWHALFALAYALQKIVAVDVRQSQVEYDKGRLLDEKLEGGRAIGGFENLIALRRETHAQEFADGRLIVHVEDFWSSRRHPLAGRLLLRRFRDGKRDGENRPGAVGAVGCRYCAVHRFDEASRDGETQPGTGTNLVAFPRAIEFIKDALEVPWRNAVTLIQNLQMDALPLAPTLDGNGRSARSVLCGVVEQIEQHLLEQHRIHHNHGQVGTNRDLDAMFGEDLASTLKSAPDDLPNVVRGRVWHDGTGLQLRHVQEVGDEAIEAL